MLRAEPGFAADLPVIRIGVLKFGTARWEMAVIADEIDQRHGFRLKTAELADKDAASVALLAGQVDVIVTDWLWVAKQRQRGRRYTFFPFSNAVGAVMAHPSADIRSVSDLKGRRLGIAGGATDKSWILLQAFARKSGDFDLAASADVQFAAPPLLNELLLRRRLDAVLTFWQFAARLADQGMQPVAKIADILPALGLTTPPPLLGWVFDEDWAGRHAALAGGFLDASREAKQAMKARDDVWQTLRPMMAAATDHEFALLRHGYQEGIPSGDEGADIAAAEKTFELMREFTPAAVADLDALPAGTFWQDRRP
ncbi:MAG TPA: ABC transporter substrate-binding protein [Ferrovibrio sp.]|uniref:ABC transporter substrate-binding protein n=1 Tax=Ferrovibrio sp. TaxID=1917215 RepID=UPI002ED699B7